MKILVFGADNGQAAAQRMQIPAGSIAFGNPAKVAKQASEEAIAGNRKNAEIYVRLAKEAKNRENK